MSNEKHQDVIEPTHSSTDSVDISKVDLEDGEVFRTGEGLVNFRTVSWIHTSVIFLKREPNPAINKGLQLTTSVTSDLCNWCPYHPIRHVYPRGSSRCHQCARLAVSEHMVRPRSGTIQSQSPWVPQYRRHGSARWRTSREGDHRHPISGGFHHRRCFRNGWCVHRAERTVQSLPLHKLLLDHRSAHGRLVCQRP